MAYGQRGSPIPSGYGQPSRPAIQAHYGALDERAMADLPALAQRLRDAVCVCALRTHPGVGRRFWEPGRGEAAVPAIEAAWQATLDWFETHLVQEKPPAAPAGARPN